LFSYERIWFSLEIVCGKSIRKDISVLLSHVSVLLADRKQWKFEGLGKCLAGEGARVLRAGDLEETLSVFAEHEPTMVLFGTTVGTVPAAAAVAELRLKFPDSVICLCVDGNDADGLLLVHSTGANGYITTTMSVEDARSVFCALGGVPAAASPDAEEDALSSRQVQILAAVVAGMNVREIGKELAISHKTVNNHLTAIYRRLDAQNLTQAIVKAAKLGLISVG
jgi:DNA-binding NarL/FixJ family response regulator